MIYDNALLMHMERPHLEGRFYSSMYWEARWVQLAARSAIEWMALEALWPAR